MKTEKKRTGVRLAGFLMLAVLLTLAFAGCGLTDVQTVAQTTAESSTDAPITAASTEITEPEIGEGVVPLRTAGASVAFDPIGLSFTGFVAKEYHDALTAAYGDENVKVGFLIVPTDSEIGFTPDSRRLEAETLASEGDDYRFDCALTTLEEKDYTVRFSFVSYVEVCGKVLRCAAYDEDLNSASLADTAQASYADVTDVMDTKHKYSTEVGGKTKYSPYTRRQRELLFECSYPCAFTVMSYNIEVYDSRNGWEGRNPSKALDTVLEKSPDIVGFQEVNGEWDAKLTLFAASGGYTRLKGNYSEDQFERNEIFFKTDKFTLISEGTKVFKTTATELNVPNTENADLTLDRHGRIFHYAVLEQKETGKRILVVNAHLHYGGTGEGHEEDDKVRRHEIRTLLAWLEKQSRNYSYQIVLGDMNSHYKGTGQGAVNMKLFTDGGLQMTSQTATVASDVGGTLAINGRVLRERWIFDYILTKGNFGTATYTVVDNPVDENGTYPSDHLPVLAKVCCK